MGALSRLRVLVVDDNPHMLRILKTLLRGYGIEQVTEAHDPLSAMDRIRRETIDICICDYKMTDLTGLDFLRQLRSLPDGPERFMPVIMLTAHTEHSRVAAARDAGVTEFCAKPVTAQELARKLTAVIERPRPFVQSATYFGPDRRRRKDPDYQGPERRGDGAISLPEDPSDAAPEAAL